MGSGAVRDTPLPLHRKDTMIYIGIDPGLTGAVGVLYPYEEQAVYDLPTMQNVRAAEKGRVRLHLDSPALCGLLSIFDPMECRVFIEYTQAGMKGALANYSLGHSSGIIMGVLSALGFTYELVRPQEWKKEFGLFKAEKDASRKQAIALYPLLPLSRKKDHGRAEAILLAEYGRRRFTGPVL